MGQLMTTIATAAADDDDSTVAAASYEKLFGPSDMSIYMHAMRAVLGWVRLL